MRREAEHQCLSNIPMAKYTVLDYGADVLGKAARPMTYQEIWETGKGFGFAGKLSLKGKTPWQTLGARLFVDVRDNPASRFIKVGKNPARFWLRLRESEISEADLRALQLEKLKGTEPKALPQYHERKLHPLVAYFAFANTSFNRGKQIFTKTIFHEKSLKKALSEWVHPDMVGFYLPLEDWNDKLIEFNKATDKGAIRLYSFEIKKHIDRNNYRESFFQAVSNSSWANEGYLVAGSIQQNDDLMAELERLSGSFGIGIIVLDLTDFDSSHVLFPARSREVLDWELMNKLCDQNEPFETFIDNVRKDYEVKTIHKSEFDQILEDPDDYIEKDLGIVKGKE